MTCYRRRRPQVTKVRLVTMHNDMHKVQSRERRFDKKVPAQWGGEETQPGWDYMRNQRTR